MQVIDAQTIARHLDYPGLIEALHRAHLGDMPETAHMVTDEPSGGDNKFVSLVGWQRDGIIAVKLVGVFPGNLARTPPEPSVQGVVAVFDARTGAPQLVADGAEMTFRKTAADSGLGARLLARPDAQVLLIVGAGGLAPHVIEAHRAARPSISRVLIWNRTTERAEALAARLQDAAASVAVVRDLDAAVSQADVISTVTMSTAPLVKGACLKAGAHLDLIGAYRPDMRETDDAAIRRGAIFVDSRAGIEGAGDLAQPVAQGVIGWDAIRADLFELCAGTHPGRCADHEITVYKNNGGGHLDLFAARHLMTRCNR